MQRILSRLSKDHWPIFLIGNISAAINLILPLVLVRLFSPDSMGIYKIFFLYLGIIPFIMLAGGPLHSVYFWIGKKENSAEYIQSAWLSTVMLSVGISIPILLMALIFKDQLPINFTHICIVIFCSIITCPTAFYAEVSLAKGRTIWSSFVSLSFELIKTLGFIYIAWKTKDINILFNFYLIIMLLSFILMHFLLIKDNILNFKTPFNRIKEVLNYSMPISLSSGLYFLVDKADQLILSMFLLTEDFAFFAMGSLVIPPLYLLETSVQKKLIPSLSKHYENSNFLAMKHDMRKAIGDISFLMIPAIFGLIFFAKPIITILYTSQYVAAAIYLQIFALSYFLLLIPHDSILRASGKTQLILKTNIVFAPLSILTLFIIAKYTNPIATLAVALVIKLIPKLYCFHISASVIQTKLVELFPWAKLTLFTVISLVLSLISIAFRDLFSSDIYWFLICAPIFAIIYISILIKKFNKA